MITRFRAWFSPVLPLVYDDSLSYYEQLCKLVKKTNEVIDTLNEFNVNIENMVDGKIATLKDYVDAENLKQDDNLDAEIEKVYNDLNDNVSAIYQSMHKADDALRLLIKVEIEKLKHYIDTSLMGKIYVYDPTMGYAQPLDIVLNNIYDILRYHAVTCYEFDSFGTTAQDFDYRQMNARTFDTESREVLGKYYPHFMFNPVTGVYERIQYALYSFIQSVRVQARTAEQYEAMSLNATQLDNVFAVQGNNALAFDTGQLLNP